MTDQGKLLQAAISEYDSTANSVPAQSCMHCDSERLVRALSKHHEWTDQGAEAVVRLANEFGAFMLRNALALAIVLDQEDGDLDF